MIFALPGTSLGALGVTFGRPRGTILGRISATVADRVPEAPQGPKKGDLGVDFETIWERFWS